MQKKRVRNKSYRIREISVIAYFFLAVFVCMMLYFMYFQFFKSEDFINSSYNTLQDHFSDTVVRGQIISSDGVVLAETKVDSDGNETRVYPYKNMFAHVVGYSVNGKSGLEQQANFNLLRSHQFFVDKIGNEITDNKNIGDNVVTTVNYELQKVAYNALGDYDGAVIAIEPSTGKILTMVSKPDYDPNTISQNWETVNGEGSTALYNRATQGQYAPGSVFKIFTLLEFYRENPNNLLNYSFDCDGTYTSDGTTIHCAGNEEHGEETLKDSFANSCNASFAEIGLKVDNNSLQSLCNNMLFNQDLPISFASKKSRFSLSKSDSVSMTMETSIGQGKTMVSPLHMVMIAAAICNDGEVMTPYLVDHVENHKQVNVETNKPTEYKSIMSKKESSILEEYMAAVVSDGTGRKLQSDEYEAFGKTGTAQVSDTSDQTNAWFVGYAKDGDREIAIAVVVENSGYGSKYAVPIAKKVFDTYFK